MQTLKKIPWLILLASMLTLTLACEEGSVLKENAFDLLNQTIDQVREQVDQVKEQVKDQVDQARETIEGVKQSLPGTQAPTEPVSPSATDS